MEHATIACAGLCAFHWRIASAFSTLFDCLSGLRLHDMRHTFCTRLLQAGVDVATVRDLAGHSDLSVTSVYLHSGPASRIAAVAKLAASPRDNVISLEKPPRMAQGERKGGR